MRACVQPIRGAAIVMLVALWLVPVPGCGGNAIDPFDPGGLTDPGHINVGLRVVEDLSALAVLGGEAAGQPDVWVETQSSVDLSAANNDGFVPEVDEPWQRVYRYYDAARDEYVLAEVKGPGCLTRMFFAIVDGLASPVPDVELDTHDVRVYLDDPDTPVIEATMAELGNGTIPGLPRPLVAGEADAAGGVYVNVPMPFRSYCRIAAAGLPHFHTFTFNRYPTADGITTWTPADDLTGALALVEAGGASPYADIDAATLVEEVVTVPAGGNVQLEPVAGPGTVIGLELVPDAAIGWNETVRQDLTLRIGYDGETVARVDAPLGLLTGTRHEAELGEVLAVPFGRRADGTGYIHFAMPFASELTLALLNAGDEAVPMTVRLWLRPGLPAGDWGYFSATATHVPKTLLVHGQDVPVFNATGRGRIVAMTQDLTLGTTLATLEGNTRIYIDGRRSPSVVSDGHETWWGTAWYGSALDAPYQEPLQGLAAKWVDVSALTVCYAYHRAFIGDSIPWEHDIAVSFQHGGVNEQPDADYRVLTMFYQHDAPGLVLSDTIDPGDAASEAAHGYTVEPAVSAEMRTAVFEGRELEDVTDDGYAIGTRSRFEADIDPANSGVRLLRLSDPTEAMVPQAAGVWVDGVFVGEWYQPHSNPATLILEGHTILDPRERWLEDGFLLPASVTAGKSRITVELIPLGTWSEYHWQVWSRR